MTQITSAQVIDLGNGRKAAVSGEDGFVDGGTAHIVHIYDDGVFMGFEINGELCFNPTFIDDDEFANHAIEYINTVNAFHSGRAIGDMDCDEESAMLQDLLKSKGLI